MTNKAHAILRKMKLGRLIRNPKTRDQVLGEFNRSTLDDVGPLGGEKGETFLKELNEMADLESDAGKRQTQ